AASVCDKEKFPRGAGLTGYYIRYERMNLPMAPLSEGTPPSNSSFAPTESTVVLEQWGDTLVISDLAKLTTKHPLVQKAMELLADNAQSVIDREIQVVWLTGTNIQYHDGTVLTRSGLNSTTNHKITDTVIHKAVVTMVDNGAPGRDGPAEPLLVKGVGSPARPGPGFGMYVGIAGPQV